MQISAKQKKILSVLADGNFHSGNELAAELGISRAAVWKQLGFLTELELPYTAVNGKGYRLERPLQPLQRTCIEQAIEPAAGAMISVFEIHDQLASTNSYLSEMAARQAPSGYVCLAEQQTAGRGRRGRRWVSPYGSNIYLSILWRFHVGPAAVSALSLAVGVAAIRALRQLNIDEAGLKWPNDVYCHGKKLGGILIEMSGEAEGPCAAVIGLGLNVLLSDREGKEIDQAWTDLSRISNTDSWDRNRLIGTLLNHLFRVLDNYETVGIGAYLDEWRSYDCMIGQQAQVLIGELCYEGRVAGIDDQGLLLMQDAEGTSRAFASGELSFNSRNL